MNALKHRLQTLTSLEPDWIEPWLTHTLSLTEKLRTMTGQAHIELMRQGWERASWWDTRVLGVDVDLVFKRNIIMRSHNNACWFATTIIPESTYDLEKPFFDRLEIGPLTPLVFNEPKVVRTGLFHYAIDAQCIEWYWALREGLSLESPSWVRLSTFRFLYSASFYLIEIMLPGLKKSISCS